MRKLMLLLFALMFTACSQSGPAAPANGTASNTNATAPAKKESVPVYTFEIVKTHPHDPQAFTQGLFYHDGFLYESTGQEGRSQLRKVEIATGKVLQKWDLPGDNFGEGAALLNDKIYQITWRNGIGRVFSLNELKLLREFSYIGEGWGLTTDGTNLIMSQGTHVLKFMEPESFKQTRTLPVLREDGRPLMNLNELEYVNGEIWANVWHSERPDILGKTNHIARIDPENGKIVGWIDLTGISPDDQPKPDNVNDPFDPKAENTLNGIAYDPATGRIWVTGKNWRKLYEIRVVPKNQ
ncbi:MAG: glutaminyl-peptide cyclotransferase [Acidobacteria bacterium]|nr:glutaminyl-peptide cyclotransferase [Acidobacteriota bacterium]